MSCTNLFGRRPEGSKRERKSERESEREGEKVRKRERVRERQPKQKTKSKAGQMKEEFHASRKKCKFSDACCPVVSKTIMNKMKESSLSLCHSLS